MFLHIKVGEMENRSMDKNFKELVEKMIDQHDAILEFNKNLIENLAKPALYIPKEKE
jgi:hypothetical protein